MALDELTNCRAARSRNTSHAYTGSVMANVHLLIGTRKGAWVYTADETRREWSLSQPMMPGWTINHLTVDTRRETPRLLAGGCPSL